MSSQKQPLLPSAAPSCIRFVVNGQPQRLDNPDPNRTLLNHLREALALTGTKEGCAEGDCGACTVVVSEPHGQGVRRRAVNACIQLLPTLHGKEVLTVEGLAKPGGDLHPVQQAMVDVHASQCGFCTPGFVMSLHALLGSKPEASRDEIECALAGNLCRCTGYRPIIDAARKAGPQCAKAGAACRSPVSSEADAGDSVALDVQGRQFWAPVALGDFAALRMAHPEARILAGGTDLGLVLTKKRMDLPALLYVGRVEALRRVERSASHLEIGAAVTLTDAFEPLVEQYPELGEWARRFASVPIRNAGTLGGNIGNGSPIGDSMPVLMVLDASLVLRRGPHTREVPLDTFYTGYQRNVLVPGEFIERIRIPLRDPRLQVRAYKISKRFDQDISAVCGAFSLVCGDGGTVQRVRVAFGGMAATPSRAPRCEAALQQGRWDEAAVCRAMAALDEDFEPIDDMRASKSYRQVVARNLLRKFHFETTGDARISVLDEEVFA